MRPGKHSLDRGECDSQESGEAKRERVRDNMDGTVHSIPCGHTV